MNEYREYTIIITFSSSVGSKLQSDTIFGHICWALRYLKTEDALKAFLQFYDKATDPPLLVSNGFPQGYLPKPIIPPAKQAEIQTAISESKDERVSASHKVTLIKKMVIIPKRILLQFQRTPITPSRLFSAMYQSYDSIMRTEKEEMTVTVQHNTIDREKGSVRQGGLYAQEETFFGSSSATFELYLKTNYFSKEELMKIFRYISTEGFGRDSSTGKGHFKFDIAEGIDFPEVEKPNAFMTLSSYMPTANDPVKGYYGIVHKYGKLGGLYSKGVSEVNGNPFKVPLIMFSAGSTFHDTEYRKGKVYGGMVDDVHQKTEIRHYAYAFPIGINIEGCDENV
jgi:CRISPR-associated protein Csm4